jgi:predicted transcriptional regulator
MEKETLLRSEKPDDKSWSDHVRRKIAAGIKAADEGRLVPHEEVKKRFCLDKK